MSFCRRFATAAAIANHYSVLGVTPKATQMEIKAAYYELSKLYHPDINKDAEAAVKFRQINEAYEVIGNVTNKKLYDKGAFSRADFKPARSHHESSGEGKVKAVKVRTPGHNMETVYDFDTWTKEHYGNTFERKQEDIRRTRATNYIHHSKTSEFNYLYLGMGLGVILVVFILLKPKDLDTVEYENRGNNER